MKRPLTFLFVSALAFSSTPSVSAEEHLALRQHQTIDRSAPPAPGPSRSFSLPDIRQFELDNGLRVTLIDRPGFPTVAARLLIRAGMDTADGNVAVPILTTRLLRDGAAEMTSDDIANLIDGNGLGFSASTAPDSVVLAADAISTKVPRIFELLSALATSAVFPEDRVEARKAEYIGEIELALAQPDFHLDRLALRVLFGEHPYALQTPEVEQIQAISADALREHYAQTFAPSRAVLTIVGDLPVDIEEQVRGAFEGWKSDALPWTPVAQPSNEICNEAHVVVRPGSVQTAVAWVGRGYPQTSADFAEALATNQILGGGASARLFMVLREAKSYTYGAYSRMQQWAGTATLRAYSNVRGAVTDPAVTDFAAELDRMATQPVSEAELKDASDYLRGVFPIDVQTNAALASQVNALQNLGISTDYLASYRDRVAEVTTADVSDFSARLYDRARLSLVMVGEREQVVPAAVKYSSTVHVYDLTGARIETIAGELPSTCSTSEPNL